MKEAVKNTIIAFYKSGIKENIVLADAMLDGLTLNVNDAHCILKIIRNMGIVYISRPNSYILKDIYRSTYYLAKIKKRNVKNYIVVKRKNERII
jgi:hypothetical protein